MKWLRSYLIGWAILFGAMGIVLSTAIAAFRQLPGNDSAASVIRESAYWPAWLFCLGSSLAVCRWRWRVGDRPDPFAQWARSVYSAGCAALLLHIAIAFHAGHGWSHAHAIRHVEKISGFGLGLYVNYAFATVWLVDVLWAWASFDLYCRQSRWLNWSVLVFLAFIVFNAAVVFGSGLSRIVTSILFTIPLHAIWATRPWASMSSQWREPS